MAMSKTRKSRRFFSKIFKYEFLILAVEQNRKLGNKKTLDNFRDSRGFRVFDLAAFDWILNAVVLTSLTNDSPYTFFI